MPARRLDFTDAAVVASPPRQPREAWHPPPTTHSPTDRADVDAGADTWAGARNEAAAPPATDAPLPSAAAVAATTSACRPRIPHALLALPRPVVAAAMRQKQQPPPHEASSPGGEPSIAGLERQGRTAKRQWLEQAKLLHQRAALLGKEVLPQAALAEHEMAETIAPVLAEMAERERARFEEAAALTAARRRTCELTKRFSSLVTHIGAGGDFLEVSVRHRGHVSVWRAH